MSEKCTFWTEILKEGFCYSPNYVCFLPKHPTIVPLLIFHIQSSGVRSQSIVGQINSGHSLLGQFFCRETSGVIVLGGTGKVTPLFWTKKWQQRHGWQAVIRDVSELLVGGAFTAHGGHFETFQGDADVHSCLRSFTELCSVLSFLSRVSSIFFFCPLATLDIGG